MGLEHIRPGENVPNDINVLIEIPSNQSPVKYEVDKESGAVKVDRFLTTSMVYPCEYGFVPNTLAEDGDPVDVLVISPFSLVPGAVLNARPIGLLRMTDEAGKDAKILAVPSTKICSRYQHITKPADLGEEFLAMVKHFFEHYKDLDKNKWVKVEGWEEVKAAHQEIMQGIERFSKGG